MGRQPADRSSRFKFPLHPRAALHRTTTSSADSTARVRSTAVIQSVIHVERGARSSMLCPTLCSANPAKVWFGEVCREFFYHSIRVKPVQ